MPRWIEVGSVADFPAGEKKCVDVGEVPAVVCNVGGRLCAAVNICPHAGLPVGDGELTGGILICPYHGYAFDVASGRVIDSDHHPPLKTLGVRVTEAQRVQIDADGQNAE